MKPTDAASLRQECHDLTIEATQYLKLLRDYAHSPGNAWLAKGELAKIRATIGEIDHLIEQIKQADR